ncbi:MAG TPA: stage II sporulation protein M [Beutenbergiaceae bacterium]|nr:stage II sporulation protein M [Beutenbergiaceae bacterium]
MDVDAHVALRSNDWARLEQLASKRRLSGPEVDELIRLYQQTSADLSAFRTHAPEGAVVNRLSALLTRARGRTTIGGVRGVDLVKEFFAFTLPAAFYRIRWWTVWVMVGFIVVAAVSGAWIYSTPGALEQVATPAERQYYAESAFESYYSNLSAPDFTQVVWVNNAYVAAQEVALGVTGILPILVLVENAFGIGVSGAIMAEADRLDIFFYLILPHGQLELTAVFVAAAAGLKVFWSWVAPGALPRGRSLAREGRALTTVAIGLVVVLGVSGVIEGFVPRSALPAPVQIAIGTLALAAYWLYTLILGRSAVEQGYTGDLRRDDRGAERAWAL